MVIAAFVIGVLAAVAACWAAFEARRGANAARSATTVSERLLHIEVSRRNAELAAEDERTNGLVANVTVRLAIQPPEQRAVNVGNLVVENLGPHIAKEVRISAVLAIVEAGGGLSRQQDPFTHLGDELKLDSDLPAHRFMDLGVLTFTTAVSRGGSRTGFLSETAHGAAKGRW